jgi:hypothetical protein
MVRKACQALFAIYLFLCGFILAICVFVSNADWSPEIRLDLIHHPISSILLIVLVVVPFVLMATIRRGARWSWLGMRVIAAGVTAFGIGWITSNSGASGGR